MRIDRIGLAPMNPNAWCTRARLAKNDSQKKPSGKSTMFWHPTGVSSLH